MDEVKKFIESGILELYVLQQVSSFQAHEVERMAAMHPEVKREINTLNHALYGYARAQAVEPDPFTLPMLMARISYMDRLKNGEQPSFPPPITEHSAIDDYTQWLDREDLQLRHPLDQAQLHIIGYTPEATTAIVWLQYGAPPEVHTNELEKFLVVEGTCDITIGNKVHSLAPGDSLIIPLHMNHYVQVTSDIPCKIILQRAAA